jgi:acetylornithine aminotransferase
VALTVLEISQQQKLDERAAQLGQRLLTNLQQSLAKVAGVKEIRGRGLMLAVELDRPCKDIMKLCLDAGLLVNVTADSVVRLLPPLILSDTQADEVVAILGRVVRGFLEVT